MAASHFSSVVLEVKNLIGENSILKSAKDANKFGITLVMIVEQSPQLRLRDCSTMFTLLQQINAKYILEYIYIYFF